MTSPYTQGSQQQPIGWSEEDLDLWYHTLLNCESSDNYDGFYQVCVVQFLATSFVNLPLVPLQDYSSYHGIGTQVADVDTNPSVYASHEDWHTGAGSSHTSQPSSEVVASIPYPAYDMDHAHQHSVSRITVVSIPEVTVFETLQTPLLTVTDIYRLPPAYTRTCIKDIMCMAPILRLQCRPFLYLISTSQRLPAKAQTLQLNMTKYVLFYNQTWLCIPGLYCAWYNNARHCMVYDTMSVIANDFNASDKLL